MVIKQGRINGKSVEEASMAEIRETIRKISSGETSLRELHEESENEDQ